MIQSAHLTLTTADELAELKASGEPTLAREPGQRSYWARNGIRVRLGIE